MNIRNVAIIAHVDHGKTTLVDGLLKQSKTFRENEAMMSQDLIMDSNDQERERGITILAKNTAVTYKDTKINIIDTPGHADFGGEVERTLNMADGALLLVDAQEGPMPQTKFVLKKALQLGLKIIVVINKIDKKDARIKDTLHRIYDLFLELATDDSQLDIAVLYAVGRQGSSWSELADYISHAANSNSNKPTPDLTAIFEAILKYIPEPKTNTEGPFQMLVSSLDWDSYRGKYAIGRITQGQVKPGDTVVILKTDNSSTNAIVEKVFVNEGLKKVESDNVTAGDIVALTGLKDAGIGDTIADPKNPEALSTIVIDEPTLSISIGPNTSPFMGKEGKFFTSRQILERIERELQTNIAMRFKITEDGQYILSGRGELHLSVFLETLRREGFELSVSKPEVITKTIDGIVMEPFEELTIDTENDYIGNIKSELGRRRGILISQEELTINSSRLVFEISTRGIIGLRGVLMSISKGTATINSNFLRYEKYSGALQKLRKGVLVASETGKTAPLGLTTAQSKGDVFVGPQTPVYAGQIVGTNGRDADMEINVCKEKQLSNVRSVGEEAYTLTPPVVMSLEQCLGFLEEDELLEVTPLNLRLRKKILDHNKRYREQKNS
ncbi:translational GTPase TypA [candidate division WWE3 bacterium]|jgi:GTP-binding protein|uniref:50S ribosomal subunit assembly factor BipA n=1 Tax=candidate division WWE3 bacterium TaxID=2053526 RepID=A0A3A4ZCN2_UNCKA|nr:MAG: translational GTPase TypA [candidate division WWE3 bacterium]